MKQFSKGQEVWCYNYEQGLFSAKVQDGIEHYGGGMTLLLETGNKMVALTREMFESKKIAEEFATAINYRRGWLKREFENNPSEQYKIQLQDSMDSFPELYI